MASPHPVTDIAQHAASAHTTATVVGQWTAVSYSDLAPGFSGLAQANIVLPLLSSGDHAVVLTVGDAVSNKATISVR